MIGLVSWDRGIGLPEHGLWLDPHTKRDLAFVSHAHTDHVRRHHHCWMTSETLTLTAHSRRSPSHRLIKYGEPVPLGGATMTAVDAGHMLGSAQFLLQTSGASLLYTGDVKLRPGAGKPRTVIPKCDVLVMESTYGRPQFRFPDSDSALESIARWCRNRLASGVTPVLLATALGKAQELMLGLAPLGFRFALESRCLAHAASYRAAGVAMPEYTALDPDAVEDRVVIAPPAGKAEVRLLRRYRSALVSGWAMDDGFWRKLGADVAIPFSDHCDFDELVELARLSGAEHVYTVHGYAAELARHLRRRGARASALAADEQLELAI